MATFVEQNERIFMCKNRKLIDEVSKLSQQIFF